MEICPECGHIAYYDPYFKAIMCTNMDCGYMKRVRESHADHIRNMDNVELSHFLADNIFLCPDGADRDSDDCGKENCQLYWLDWLNKPLS